MIQDELAGAPSQPYGHNVIRAASQSFESMKDEGVWI